MPLYNGPQDPLSHVISFLDRTICDYAIKDLQRLGEIRPDPEPPNLRACTVPECLAIFAVLDLMGFLMRKDFDDEEGLELNRLIEEQDMLITPAPDDLKILKSIGEKAKKTSDNLRYMLVNWFSKRYEGYDEWAMDMIITLFRHGGAHQFLPKAAGIAKWGPRKPLIVFERVSGFPRPVLNEDRFREDSIATLQRIVHVVKTKDEEELKSVCGDTVEELAIRMSNRLAARHWLDRDVLKKILRSSRPDLLVSHGPQSPWATSTLPSL